MRSLLSMMCLATAALAQNNQTVVDNDQVRVLVVHEQPHRKTTMHKHDVNRVMVYLNAGKQNFEYEDKSKKPSVLNFQAGEPKWSPSGGLHTAEITSPVPVTIVEIELKKSGGTPAQPGDNLDPLKAASKFYKREFENDQVRVFRGKVPPHAQIPMHSHLVNRVVIYLTDQNFKITGDDGKEQTVTHKAGDVTWSPAPAKHKEENLSDKPFEVIMVDLKQ